jgi:hypothetical protein
LPKATPEALRDQLDAITTGSLLLFDGVADLPALAEDFRHRLTRQRMLLLGGPAPVAMIMTRQLVKVLLWSERTAHASGAIDAVPDVMSDAQAEGRVPP